MKTTIVAAALAVALAGCSPITVKPGGVLDMRSDGSEAALAPATKEVARSGFDGFLYGDGVKPGDKGTVVIDDRQHHAIALVPILNDMGDAEMRAARKDAALRDVHIGDSRTSGDAVWIVVGYASGLIPFVGNVAQFVMNGILPPWTVTVSGTRIQTGTAEVPPPPPATDLPAPPADPAQPATRGTP